MAGSTYSSNLKIELMSTGENSGTWGDITNTNMGTALEQAIVGLGNPDFIADANLTITITNTNAAQAARALVLNVTSVFGSLTATRELVVPTFQKQYIVQNNTAGGQSILVKTSAGTGITVPNGRKAHLYVDGTNVVQMFDFVDINGGAIDGTTVGAAAASTGAFTTLNASGATTLNGSVALGDAAADLITVPGTLNSNLLFTDNSFDIGATGANRPRNLFLSGAATVAGNLSVGGTLTLTGGVNLNGNVTIGDAPGDTLTINSTITSNLLFTDNTFDIGASGATRPRNLFLAGNATIGGAQTLTGALTVDSTTDSTSATTGSIQTDGGVGIAKALFVGTNITVGSLTSTRVPYASTGGLLIDSANMTFNGTRLTVADLTDSSLTAGLVTFAGAGGNLTDDVNFSWNGTGLGLGTSDGSYLLDVRGGATSNVAAFTSTATTAYTPTAVNQAKARLILSGGSAAGATVGMALSAGGLNENYFGVVQEAGGAGAFVFQGFSGTAYAERARLDSASRLAVGPSTVLAGRISAIQDGYSCFTAQASTAGVGTTVAALKVTDLGAGNFAHAVYDALSHLWETSGADRFEIDAGGRVGFGTQGATTDRLIDASFAGANLAAGANQFGLVLNPTYPNTVTTNLFNLYAGPNVTAGATITNVFGLYLEASNTAGSTVTNKYGVYQAGVADRNYFAGAVGLAGATNPANVISLGDVSGIDQDINSMYVGANFTGIGALYKKTNNFACQTHYDSALGIIKFKIAPQGTAGNAITAFNQVMSVDANGLLTITASPGNQTGINLEGTAANTQNYRLQQGIVGISNSGFSLRDTTNNVTRLAIDASGGVNINPAGGGTGVKLYVYGGGTGALGAIQISDGAINGVTNFWNIGRDNTTSGAFTFALNGVEHARIGTNGFFTIGTPPTGSAYRLWVYDGGNRSQADAQISITGNGYQGFHFLDGTAYYIGQNSQGRDLRIYSGNDPSIGVRLTPNNNAWQTYSDERMKDIIEPIENALAKVLTLRTVIGKYKQDAADKRRVMMIAQDVKAVLPEATTEDADGMLGMAYDHIVPLLTAALKELANEFNAYKASHP